MFTEYKRTYISRKNIRLFTKRNLSARKMVEYLEHGFRYRSFSDILSDICDPKELIDAICISDGQSRETVRKRVHHWINGTFTPRREEVFQIAFLKKLSLEQANKLLLSVSETGIHYRNPVELIYVYGLEHNLTWEEVTALRLQLLTDHESALSQEKRPDSKEDTENMKESEEIPVLTKYMEMDFHQSVHNRDDLETFLRSRSAELGQLRKTVYDDFIRMIHLLKKGEKDARKMSVEELVSTYIGRPPQTSRNYDYLIRIIRKNWPSKDKLYKMIERKQNVSRKTMLLLFLITEEFSPETDYNMEDLSSNERLQIRIQAMNLYLDSYGMNRLDLGNPFDCMILYALKASYEESMSERLTEILKLL